jgi:hypothetical protein
MAWSTFLLLAAILRQNAASWETIEPRAASPAIWPRQTYVTENFAAPDLKIKRHGNTAPGYLFITPMGDGTDVNAPVIITDTNELIWRGPSGGWTYENFKVQQLHKQPVLTTWYGNSSDPFGHGYGAVQIWNTSYSELYKVCPTGLGIVTPNHIAYDCYLDEHESYLTDRGTIIANAFNVTQKDLTSVGGPANGWIFDSLFYEIDVATQEVLFRWRSLDHLSRIPLTDSHYPLELAGIRYGVAETSPWDYFHINSIQPLSDGYLVDSRHLFSIYKVSNITGNVEWHLSGRNGGDFTLDPDVYFSWQHMPRISNVTKSSLYLTLFNNDNSEAQVARSNGSTGLALFVNLETKHVSLDRKLVKKGESIIAAAQGSYQTLEQDHVLVGYGRIAITREFDASNKVVYEARYGYSNNTSLASSYRSFRQPWNAQPVAAPKIAVQFTKKDTTLYASWNGATTYSAWQIYVGDSIADMVPVATTAKKGFETRYTVKEPGQYAKVVAIGKEGALGTSNTVRITR